MQFYVPSFPFTLIHMRSFFSLLWVFIKQFSPHHHSFRFSFFLLPSCTYSSDLFLYTSHIPFKINLYEEFLFNIKWIRKLFSPQSTRFFLFMFILFLLKFHFYSCCQFSLRFFCSLLYLYFICCCCYGIEKTRVLS